MDDLSEFAFVSPVRPGSRFLLGQHKRDGRVVVARVYQTDGTPSALERLAQAADRLYQEPIDSVLSPLSRGQKGHDLVLVFDHDGPDRLSELLRRAPLARPEFLTQALDLARCLESLHRHGHTHAHLNPETIRIEADGSYKLVDPSLSHLSQVAADSVFGQFLAPEQLGLRAVLVDTRADLFSLGILLYRLVTGDYPFSDTSMVPLESFSPPPGVDRDLVEVLQKLLRRRPADRYQTIQGLVWDLERALQGLAFEVGAHERHLSLRWLEAPVGREVELDRLWPRLEATQREQLPVFCVFEGPPGTGKTTLVRSFLTECRARGICAVEGQCSAQNESPGGILEVAANLCAQMQALEPERLQSLIPYIQAELQGSCSILRQALPQLEHFMEGCLRGLPPSPPPSAVPPADDSPERLMARLVAALAHFFSFQAQLQGTLVLFLDELHEADRLTRETLRALRRLPEAQILILGCRRPLQQADGSDDVVQESEVVSLAPLSETGLRGLLGRVLVPNVDDLPELARLLWLKTEGNPLAIRTLLSSLVEDGSLRNLAGQGWSWDRDRVLGLPEAEGGRQQLARRLGQLKHLERRILLEIALLGPPVRQDELLVCLPDEAQQIADALRGPLHDNLVVESEQGYCFGHPMMADILLRDLPPAQRQAQHWRCADALRTQCYPRPRVGRQVVQACPSVPADEREWALELCQECLESARRENRFDDWRTYAEAAWWLAYDSPTADGLKAQLSLQRAEARRVHGEHEEALQILKSALALPTDTLTRGRLLEAVVRVAMQLGDYQGSLRTGLETLSSLDVHLDEQALTRLLELETGTLERRLQAAPLGKDEGSRVACSCLSALIPVAFLIRMPLYESLVAALINESLSHGITRHTLRGITALGRLLCCRRRTAEAGELGKVALELSQRPDMMEERPVVLFGLATFIYPWTQSLEQAVRLNREAHSLSLRTGDGQYAGYTLIFQVFYHFFQGYPLATVHDMARQARGLARHIEFTTQVLDILERGVNGIQGGLPVQVSAGQVPGGFAIEAILQAWQTMLRGQPPDPRALDAARAALEIGQGSVLPIEYHLLRILQESTQGRLAEDSLAELRLWAETNLQNFEVHLRLAEAEQARLAGDLWGAVDKYEQVLSQGDRWCQWAAVSAERCASLLDASGRKQLSGSYRQRAAHYYRRWGVAWKAEEFEAFSGPVDLSRPSLPTLERRALTHILRTQGHQGLCQLLGWAITRSGAESGLLKLGESGLDGLLVEPGQVRQQWTALDVPQPLLNYALNQGEPLCVKDVEADTRFRDEPYLRHHKVLSLACVSQRTGQGLSVSLALFHHEKRDFFQAEHVDLVNFVLQQAALRVESELYAARLQRSEEKLALALQALGVEAHTLEQGEAPPGVTLPLVEQTRRQAQASNKAVQVNYPLPKGEWRRGIAVPLRDGCTLWLESDTALERERSESSLKRSRFELLQAISPVINQGFCDLFSGVGLNAQLLALHTPESDPRREYIEQILDLSERAAQWNSRLLAFVKPDRPRLESLDLNHALQSSKHYIRQLAGPRLQVELRLCHQEARIIADWGSLDEMVLTLVLLARESVGPDVTRLLLQTELVQRQVELTVGERPPGELSPLQPSFESQHYLGEEPRVARIGRVAQLLRAEVFVVDGATRCFVVRFPFVASESR